MVAAGNNGGRKQWKRAGVDAATTTRYGAENARGACLDEHDDNEGGIAGTQQSNMKLK